MIRAAALLVCMGLFACSGRTSSSGGDAGGASDGGADASGGDAAAADAGMDCGQPSTATYDCTRAMPDAGECTRYGGSGDTSPADAGFPLGCEVTLTVCNASYGVPQTCNCTFSPVLHGPQWLCPL